MNKNRKNMKVIILVVLLLVIAIFLTLIVYYRFIFIKSENIYMDLTVGNNIGFNTDTDALHFGTLYPGGEARRTIIIRNSNNFPVTVSIGVSGEMADWVTVVNDDILVGPKSNSSIDFIASPPPGTGLGTYTGNSLVVMKRKFD